MVFFTSCEDFFLSEVDAPELKTKPQLVLHSYISPDKPIEVSVQYSKPVFSKEKVAFKDEYQVQNAKVLITNLKTKASLEIPFDDKQWRYVHETTTDFQITEGETYLLEVTAPNGKKASGKCCVPSAVTSEITNIRYAKRDGSFLEVIFEVKDNPNEENFYAARAVGYSSENKAVKEQRYLFSDKNKNGKNILVKSSKYTERYGYYRPIETIKIHLFSVDKNYFDYAQSVSSQYDNEGNPFADPTIIISNIEGGLGVFGAYTSKTVEKKLEKSF